MPVIIYRLACVGLFLLAACILLEIVNLAARAWLRRRFRQMEAERTARLGALVSEARADLADADAEHLPLLRRYIDRLEAVIAGRQ